jgi:hypothetical protein
MPDSGLLNPTLTDYLKEDDPEIRTTEAEEDRRIEPDNEFYDGDKDQVKFLLFVVSIVPNMGKSNFVVYFAV